MLIKYNYLDLHYETNKNNINYANKRRNSSKVRRL